MYLNEKAWEIIQEDKRITDNAITSFLDIYSAVKRNYPRIEVYMPENWDIYLCSKGYSIGEWLNSADIEYRRLYLRFVQQAIRYNKEEEYEVSFEGEVFYGGTEAYLNNSFILSICLDDKWKKNNIECKFYSLPDNTEKYISIKNVFYKEQLNSPLIKEILDRENSIKVNSYDELWRRREEFFPHLDFCPSVKDNLDLLEMFYLSQVVRKLAELENYCVKHTGERFEPSYFTKVTPESKTTMEKYKDKHTFVDGNGTEHIASWHLRFTGIPGRIFFIPEYKSSCILVCYIGKKLPNVKFHT